MNKEWGWELGIQSITRTTQMQTFFFNSIGSIQKKTQLIMTFYFFSHRRVTFFQISYLGRGWGARIRTVS